MHYKNQTKRTPNRKEKRTLQRVFVDRQANISIRIEYKYLALHDHQVKCHWQLNEESLIAVKM